MLNKYDETTHSVKQIFLSKSKGIGKIQKIYSSPHLISIALRFTGETRHVWIGRGGSFIGAGKAAQMVESSFRIQDRFLEYLRKYLKNAYILDVAIDQNDNIFCLKYRSSLYEGEIGFFYKSRSLYFANQYQTNGKKYIFRSWNKGIFVQDSINIFELFNEVGRFQLKKDTGYKLILNDVEQYQEKIKKELERHSSESKKDKYFKNKIRKIEADCLKVKRHKEIKDFIENLQQDITENELNIAGYKFKFYGVESSYKKIDKLYQKIKVLKNAEIFLENRKNDTILEYNKAIKKTKSVDITKIKIVSPRWDNAENEKIIKSENISQIKVFRGVNGESIAIGLSAEGNDYLRTTWAKSEDRWFHVEGDKGAHVIIKSDKVTDITRESSIAASLIAYFEKKETDQVNLIYSPVKNLKGVRGRQGAVTIKNPRYIIGKVIAKKDWKIFLIIEDN